MSPSPAEVRTARLFVAGQGLLLVLLVVLPGDRAWPVPAWLRVVCVVAGVGGLAVMVLAGTALGRGLTAVPLPNRHAVLRTGGLYRLVRHPIYSGLLLAAGAFAVWSGGVPRAAAFVGLVLLLHVKARWEEARLAQAFSGYRAYAARTPRFVPVRPWWRRSP